MLLYLMRSRLHVPASGSRPTFARTVLLLIVLDVAIIACSTWITARSGTASWSGGFEVADQLGPPVVTVVRDNGPVAGVLKPGDRLFTIENTPVDIRTLTLFGIAFGKGAHLQIEREGRRLNLTLPTLRVTLRPGWFSVLITTLPALVLLISGASVGMLRPEIRSARLFALAALVAVPPVVTSASRMSQVAGALSPWESAFVTICHVVSPLHLVPALLFTATFPALPRLGPRWRVLLHMTIALAVVSWLASLVQDASLRVWPMLAIALVSSHQWLWDALQDITAVYPALAFAAMALVVVQKYRGTRSATDRNRLRWMIAGAAAGIIPLAVYYATLAALIVGASQLILPAWTMDISSAAVAVLPAAVAYAIARHRLFDIRVAIGRGLQYALALNVLRAGMTLALGVLAVEIVRDLDAPLKSILSRPAVWIALAVTSGLLYFRTSLLALLDRYFLRPAANSELIVMALIDELGRQETQNDIAHLLVSRINEWLHPKTMSVLFRRSTDGTFVSASTSDDLANLETRVVAAHASLIHRLEGTGESFCPGPDDGVDVIRADGAGLEMVVPIGGGDRRLIGFLALGPKHSEEPYSSKERKLLELAAAQVLVVNDNADLRRRDSEAQRVKAGVLAQLDAKGMNLLQECPACGACYGQDQTTCPLDGARLELTLPVELVVDQRWRLDRRLGSGGMGTVYKATDLRLDREVALKLMRASISSDDAARLRFEREARVLARMHHPSIVTIFEYGYASPGGNYLVMEFVAGTSLRHALSGRPVAPSRAASWFERIIDGVGYAHRLNIVHRDLKPENILLAASDGTAVPKILDFGLAKYRVGDETISVTAPGMILGTLPYMSPEQVLGDPVDKRADIFAIGVMLAEVLCGMHPFRRDTSEATAASILHDRVIIPSSLSHLTIVQPVLDRCLAKKREERFGECAELYAALVPALLSCAAPVRY